MRTRRSGRIAAMQILYQADVQRGFDELSIIIRKHFDHLDVEPAEETLQFVQKLCQGVVDNLRAIDTCIERASANWRLARMSCVDRNVLRLATYELLFEPGVPIGVAINEAVELGKSFGSSESASFLNGVLNRIAADRR
jgi:N utilization substance protein B